MTVNRVSRYRLRLPGPTAIPERVRIALGSPVLNHRGPEFAEILAEITALLRKVAGTSNDILLFACSGTGMMEASLANVLAPGDKALVVALDLSTGMLREARRQQRLFRRFKRVAADAAKLPLRNDSVDLVFSNLMLQWCNDPDAIFRETRRVLRQGGLLTFASLGPDSLRELRAAWSQIDRGTHVHRFIDMHDLGDALVRTGFAEPVMDTERLTITYSSVGRLLKELRLTGSRNLTHGRRRGLTGSTIGRRFAEACQPSRLEEVLPVTLEIVYGHAWAGPNRERGGAKAEATVPVTSIGRRRL